MPNTTNNNYKMLSIDNELNLSSWLTEYCNQLAYPEIEAALLLLKFKNNKK